MNYLKGFFLILFCVSLANCERDVCEEKLDNGINPKPVSAAADAWVVNEVIGTLEFVNLNGEVLTVQLDVDESEHNDTLCPEVIVKHNRYFYTLPDLYWIQLQEQGNILEVKTKTTAESTSTDLDGGIDGLGNFYRDGEWFGDTEIHNTTFTDLLLVTSPENVLVDSIYIQKGIGLISFLYQEEQWLRSF